MSQDTFSLDDFGGTARLFPLPNLVLFPHVAQPLHIFEPRYRQMMEDALEDDRLIALALLQPGWEEDYHKKPPIYPMVCLGQIMQEERLGDGRYNLLLRGLSRARIRQEIKTEKLYRIARVELFSDDTVPSSIQETVLRQDLTQAVSPFFANHPTAAAQFRRLVESGLPLGALCDIFSFALPLEVEIKQQLLDEVGIETRTRLLLHHLEGRAAPVSNTSNRRSFPPGFSEN